MNARQERRRRRQLRREIRREAFAFARERPNWTRGELKEHLTAEFESLDGAAAAISWPVVLELIMQIIELLMTLFGRSEANTGD